MAKEEKTKKKSEKKAPKKGKKNTALILVLALLISVVTIVMSKVVLWPKYQNYKKQQKKEQVKDIKAKKPEMGEIYELKSFTVNTYKSGGRRFAKIKLSLETHSKDVLAELEKRNPQIRSLMLKYFRSKTVEDLTQPSFPDSSAADLLKQLNRLLSSGKVDNLYYQDLIVQ